MAEADFQHLRMSRFRAATRPKQPVVRRKKLAASDLRPAISCSFIGVWPNWPLWQFEPYFDSCRRDEQGEGECPEMAIDEVLAEVDVSNQRNESLDRNP